MLRDQTAPGVPRKPAPVEARRASGSEQARRAAGAVHGLLRPSEHFLSTQLRTQRAAGYADLRLGFQVQRLHSGLRADRMREELHHAGSAF